MSLTGILPLKVKKYKFELLVFFLVFILDRLTKVLAVRFLLSKASIAVFPFLSLTYVENTGSAFGMFQNANLFLLCISVLVLFLMLKWYKDIFNLGTLARYGYFLIFAGAIGNIYDRIMLGYVVDFLDFHFWPVFNVADSAICVGAFLIGIGILKESKRSSK